MKENKVKQFKALQERLARQIAKVNKISSYTVEYEQVIPSAYTDPKTKKLVIVDNTQMAFPTKVVKQGKNRVIVVMKFQCNKKLHCVGKILKRGYWIYQNESGIEIRSSFLTHTIAKI